MLNLHETRAGGSNQRVLLPTDSELAAVGRADLSKSIEVYGGRADVARRLGRLSEERARACVCVCACVRVFVCVRERE